MSAVNESTPVTATRVDERERLNFLPDCFGPQLMLRAESMMYGCLTLMSPDYNGAYWHFYTLSDGGFYMAPDLPHRLHIEVDSNGYAGEMSADAAGIVVSLFVLCGLCVESDALVERFHQLRSFAANHPEASAIFRAID